MTQKQQKQFNKFKVFTGWMYGDSELALYLTQTQFLVALGLFDYTETLGAFHLGYFQKENGKIKSHKHKNEKCKGCSKCVSGQLKTTSIDRFKDFFSYLGSEYKNLSNTHSEIYKELRCGLSHEFLPSKRPFTIYHAGEERFTKEQIRNNDPAIDEFADKLKNELNNSRVNCGVILTPYSGEEVWQIFVPKLAADFRRAVKKLQGEIEEEKDQKLFENFFEAASQINLKYF